MFSDLDNKSLFYKKFGEIRCPCCKKNKLYCCNIDTSSINTEIFTCNTCNLLVYFFIGNSLDYYFDLDFYYANDNDYILFNRRYPYIKRILNYFIRKFGD